MADSKTPGNNNIIEDLEVKIEKYPWAISPLLIDEFYIMGYTEFLKKEKIIKPIMQEINSKINYEEFYNLKEIKNTYLPTTFSMISSETKIRRIDIEHIIDYAFPIPPKIYYYIENKENVIKEPNETNIIFNNINNETVCNGYVYGFYEKQIIEIKKDINLCLFCPKFFIIISQYNYFYAFHKICKYIQEQFLNDNNEIPLEIQIYNIVNFLPCPLNSKIELEIFARNGVLNCKNLDEYKNLGNNITNNLIYLNQLGAFKHSEINFGKIFEICSPELIIQVLVLILSEGKVAFFHENLEILSYVIYFFYQITFPITPKENIYCLSPNTYYYADSIGFVEIIGFPCDFDKITDYHPNKDNYLITEKELEIQRKLTDISRLKQYTIINLKNGNIKFFSLEDEDEEDDCEINKDEKNNEEPTYDKDEQIRVDINNFLLSMFKNPDNHLSIELVEIIYDLYKTLLTLSILIKEKKYFSYFVENDDIKKCSLDVQEAFFRFIVLFCNNYFKVYVNYQKKKKEQESQEKKDTKESDKSSITDIEQKIFSSFRKTGYNDILNNMTGYYKEGEPLFMRASKKNFDNMMSLCKADKVNKLLFKGHFIEFLDSIFCNKKNMKQENITFFEFYKYYNEKMKKNIFYLAEDDIFDKRKIVKDKEIMYYYKYKTIKLSNNLLMKYNLYLSELDENIKYKLFPEKVKMINSLYSKDINRLIEDFLFNYKLINSRNLLQFSLLSIVILSIPELKLITFTGPIYQLFPTMNLQIRKYVELILNISYRYFSTKNDIEIKEELNQYFNIYKKAIEENNLFPNDELTLLQHKINEYIKTKKEGYNLITKNIINKIINTPEESLFTLTPDNLGENYEDLQKEGKVNKKISITGSLLDNKEISEEFIYYPKTLYKRLNELVYSFYQDLDLEKIRDEYYKLVINVMFYIRLMKEKFPENTLKFLFYCLIKEKESIKKEMINNSTPNPENIENGENK